KAVLDAIGRMARNGRASVLDGFTIRPVPSRRGQTSVWNVRQEHPPASWFVKHVDGPDVFQRYVEGLQELGRVGDAVPGVKVVQGAGQDDRYLLVATHPLNGIPAQTCFERATRFDKLFAWVRSDLDDLARQLVRGLRTLWEHAGVVRPGLFDYTPQG